MPRLSATATLLAAAALARAAAIGLTPTDGFDPRLLVVGLDVVVPLAVVAADRRGHPAAPTAALALAALATGTLLGTGLRAMTDGIALSPPALAALVAAVLTMLAGATAIGRWQDRGAPPMGAGPRWIRALAVLGALALGLTLVTADVAVIGPVALDVGTLPGPVGLATTVAPHRLPLLLSALLPVAWAATREGTTHLVAACLVLGARAVVEAVADAALLPLGTPLAPTIGSTLGAVVLLVAVPVLAQVTSSRA